MHNKPNGRISGSTEIRNQGCLQIAEDNWFKEQNVGAKPCLGDATAMSSLTAMSIAFVAKSEPWIHKSGLIREISFLSSI